MKGQKRGQRDLEPKDQKLVRGNLALVNSFTQQNAVRVIRGEKKKISSGDKKKKEVKIYVYDGLYVVEDYWKETGSHGKSVFKFQRWRGCSCKKGCSESRNCCSCIAKNGGELPYNHDGANVIPKRMVYECGPLCKCPASCYLRVTQLGIKFQLEIFKTEKRGWGVRSLNSISSGSFICEYVGELLEDKEAERLTGEGEDEYLFDIDREGEENGFAINAAWKGNIGRFINHSCSPNLYAQKVLYDHQDKRLPHIMFFAQDDIPPLQELTYDYNYKIDQVLDSDGNIKKKYCYCGSEECTGRLY